MARFEDHIGPLIEKEGGYRLTNVEHDRGGETYAGISRKSNPDWEGWPFIDRGQTPPREIVHVCYKLKYWNPVRGDGIKDENVAGILFSSSVLSGPGVATVLCQCAVGVKVDGKFGRKTLEAVNACDTGFFEARFALARIARFADIAESDSTQRKFFRGWVNRVLRELQV